MFDGYGKHTTSRATSWFPHHPWPLSLHKCQLSSASSSPQPPWGQPDSSLSLLSTLTQWQILSALFSGYIRNLTAAHSTAPPSHYLLSPRWPHHSLPSLMASFLVLSLFTTASHGSHSTPSPQPESSFDCPPCPTTSPLVLSPCSLCSHYTGFPGTFPVVLPQGLCTCCFCLLTQPPRSPCCRTIFVAFSNHTWHNPSKPLPLHVFWVVISPE